jgi:signal transduction histidine kinase
MAWQQDMNQRALTILPVGSIEAVETLSWEEVLSAFPNAAVERVASIGELKTRSRGAAVEIAVLLDPQALPEGGWDAEQPVLVIGPGHGSFRGGVRISRDAWNAGGAVPLLQLLAEAARHKGDLTTIGRRIHHDLSSPLSCILTMSCLLQESEEEPASRAEYVGPIIDSANEITRMMDRVSFVAKATAMPAVSGRLDMGHVFHTAVQRMKREKGWGGVVLKSPSEWPAVDGVAPWLEAVWINLLMNALSHAGTTPSVEAGWEEQDGWNRFWLRDGGKGVAPEKKERLFHPFHRLHEPGSPKGLGLPIVHRLVELHGGRCDYEDLGPDGSRFCFLLPAVGTK